MTPAKYESSCPLLRPLNKLDIIESIVKTKSPMITSVTNANNNETLTDNLNIFFSGFLTFTN